MPYISADERPGIDEKVRILAEELARALGRGENKSTEVSVSYKRAFEGIAKAVLQLERGKKAGAVGHLRALAVEVYGDSGKASADGAAWLGRLNYAITRLIQAVPEKMVEKGVWKESFRYWLYALTVGALERTAMEIHASEGDGWPEDGVVGVLVDVKDEYKRRVNSAYEMVQIKKNGDCYATRYRTELGEMRDEAGKVIGYVEVMKDFGR